MKKFILMVTSILIAQQSVQAGIWEKLTERFSKSEILGSASSLNKIRQIEEKIKKAEASKYTILVIDGYRTNIGNSILIQENKTIFKEYKLSDREFIKIKEFINPDQYSNETAYPANLFVCLASDLKLPWIEEKLKGLTTKISLNMQTRKLTAFNPDLKRTSEAPALKDKKTAEALAIWLLFKKLNNQSLRDRIQLMSR